MTAGLVVNEEKLRAAEAGELEPKDALVALVLSKLPGISLPQLVDISNAAIEACGGIEAAVEAIKTEMMTFEPMKVN